MFFRPATLLLIPALSCLAPGGLRAQHTASFAIQHAEQLGLSRPQKTELEKIVKDIQHRLDAAYEDRSSQREQRRVKLRSIVTAERSDIARILTREQLTQLKALEFPKSTWSVQAYVWPDGDISHFSVRLDHHPAEYMTYTLKKSQIRLRVVSADGKTTDLTPKLLLAPEVPDEMQPEAVADGSQQCRFRLVMQRRGAPAGMYKLELGAHASARDIETGEAVDIPTVVATLPIYLTPEPDREPQLRPGQRFIGPIEAAEGPVVDTGYRDSSTGAPIGWTQLAGRVATLQRVEPVLQPDNSRTRRLTFVLEKHTGQIRLETGANATQLPYLTPLLTDPVVRDLKQRYERKRVWSYGGAGTQCLTTEPGLFLGMSGSAEKALTIRRIERIWEPQVERAIGAATFLGGGRESRYLTCNPLVVLLQAPAHQLEFGAMSYSGGRDVDVLLLERPDAAADCLWLLATASDRWDFERTFSLDNPSSRFAEWPRQMRKAVLEGRIVRGMTREMVAWSAGWPAVYGSRSAMLKLDDWPFDNIPFSGHVFFRNGKVVSQDWPRLP